MSDKLYFSTRQLQADMALHFSALGVGKSGFGGFDSAPGSGYSTPNLMHGADMMLANRGQASPK